MFQDLIGDYIAFSLILYRYTNSYVYLFGFNLELLKSQLLFNYLLFRQFTLQKLQYLVIPDIRPCMVAP